MKREEKISGLDLDRRVFLKVSSLLAGGVAILGLDACSSNKATNGGSSAPGSSSVVSGPGLEAAAEKEKTMLFYTQSDQTESVFADGFEKMYSWAQVTTFVGPGPALQSRVATEESAHAQTADVVVVSPGQRAAYIQQKLIAPQPTLAAFKKVPAALSDPQFYALPIYQNPCVLVYNTNQLKGVPTDLYDLASSQWKDKLAMAAPQGLSASGTLLASHRKAWGDDKWMTWLQGLKANNAFITSDDTSAYQAVLTGERPICIDGISDVLSAPKGAPVANGFYDGIAPYSVNMSVPVQATHPDMAAFFMDYALSDQAQIATSSIGKIPITGVDVPTSLDKVIPGGASALLPFSDMADFNSNPQPYVEIYQKLWPT